MVQLGCTLTEPPTWNENQLRESMNRQIGVWVVVAGLFLIGLGILIYSGAMRWFGKLPGDIRYNGDHLQFYAPLASMLVISLVLSLLFYLLRRFF